MNLGRDKIINKKLRLIMVGQGPLLEELREKVSREGFTDFILFTGLKQREKLLPITAGRLLCDPVAL
jgi:glycosyltransferase involved in cell wall biosynthesis